MSISPIQFREILVLEALPFIAQRQPELSNHIVNRIMAISFEYYVNQMFQEVCLFIYFIIKYKNN